MGEAVDDARAASLPPARNRRGERTRQELISAAWRVADRMSLDELLVGLTASVVAGEAGMTTGAFRHHFADTADLVAAMVEQHLGHREATYVGDADEVRHHEATFDAEALRAGVLGYWKLRSRPAARQRARRWRMLSIRARSTTMPDGELLVDRLAAEMERALVELDAPSLDALLERLGREWVPPFDTSTVVRVVEALCAGLLEQAELQPGAIDDETFADALSAILLTFSSPRGRAGAPRRFRRRRRRRRRPHLRGPPRPPDRGVVAPRVRSRPGRADVVPGRARDRPAGRGSWSTCSARSAAWRPCRSSRCTRGSWSRPAATSSPTPTGPWSTAACATSPGWRGTIRTSLGRCSSSGTRTPRRVAHSRWTSGSRCRSAWRWSPRCGGTERVPPADLARVIGELVDVTLEVASTTPRLSPAEVASEALRGLPDPPVSSPG